MSDDEHWRGKPPEPAGYHILMAGETPDVVLARIDERTRRTEEDIKEIKHNVQTHYVSAEQFKALRDKVDLHQKILFTVIGLICITVVGALVKLVMLPHGGTS